MSQRKPPENDSKEAEDLRAIAYDWGAFVERVEVFDYEDTTAQRLNRQLLRAALAYATRVTKAKSKYGLAAANIKPTTATRWRCKRCGRDKFTQPTSHRCNGQFRKRHLVWELIVDAGEVPPAE